MGIEEQAELMNASWIFNMTRGIAILTAMLFHSAAWGASPAIKFNSATLVNPDTALGADGTPTFNLGAAARPSRPPELKKLARANSSKLGTH
jgi:hypothetical protein